jgi:hypothetical protein
MNERMLELYGQAHVPCQRIDPSNNMPYESKEFSANKFAELIVEECIGIVEYGGEFCSRPKLVEQLKEHFGVEL